MATVDSIITEVKLAGGFPTDNYFTDPEILSIMNGEFSSQVIPLVMKLNEDFFLQNKDYTIASTNSYRIPPRNIGNKLRDIKLVVNNTYFDLNRLFEEDRSSNLSGYYIVRNSIELSSDITSGTLRMTYYLTPSELVLTTSCAKVLSIDSATQITVESLPSTIITGSLVDLVQANGPNDLLALNSSVVSASGTTLTFASLPTDLTIGDYVCVAGQSPIPLVPEIMEPMLVQATLVSCLGSKKDKAVDYESKGLDSMKKSLLEMLAPRVDSNDIKIRGQGILSYVRNRRGR